MCPTKQRCLQACTEPKEPPKQRGAWGGHARRSSFFLWIWLFMLSPELGDQLSKRKHQNAASNSWDNAPHSWSLMAALRKSSTSRSQFEHAREQLLLHAPGSLATQLVRQCFRGVPLALFSNCFQNPILIQSHSFTPSKPCSTSLRNLWGENVLSGFLPYLLLGNKWAMQWLLWIGAENGLTEPSVHRDSAQLQTVQNTHQQIPDKQHGH